MFTITRYQQKDKIPIS